MRKRSRGAPNLPWLPWFDLAWKTAETMAASAEVIAHRTARVARAGPAPGHGDRREFSLMGTEKLVAAAASMQAMTLQALATNWSVGWRALEHWRAASHATLALAGSRSAAQAVERHARLVRALSDSAAAGAHLANAGARIAQRGLAPIHARARGNARRLRGR